MREFELIEASQKQRGASLRAAFGAVSANSTDFTVCMQTETPAEPLLVFRTASTAAAVWQRSARLPHSTHQTLFLVLNLGIFTKSIYLPK